MYQLKVVLFFLAFILSSYSFAITTKPLGTVSAEDLVESLVCDINTSNIVYTGANLAAGTFTGALSTGIEIDRGIMLTSGSLSNAEGSNTSDAKTANNQNSGLAELTSIINVTTYDASVLAFDFTLAAETTLEFQYVFASEEYNEFANSAFNDVFAFFLNGNNIALLPDDQTPVSINTINNILNSDLYRNNDPSDLGIPTPYGIQYDGFTTTLVAKATVPPGTHHMKLAIADAGDYVYDSAIFLKSNSFTQVSCQLYGVHDEGIRNSQFFSIGEHAPFNMITHHNGYDFEALDAHPVSKVLFAASGNHSTYSQEGIIYPISTEGLSDMGMGVQYNKDTAITDISGLSFNPSTNSLWGWEQGKGLFLINENLNSTLPSMLTAELKWQSDLHVGDLTWNQAGDTLYLANDNTLLTYNDSLKEAVPVCTFLPYQEIESLEMSAEGNLFVGIHNTSYIYTIDTKTCNLTPAFNLPENVNDIEGMSYVCTANTICGE